MRKDITPLGVLRGTPQVDDAIMERVASLDFEAFDEEAPESFERRTGDAVLYRCNGRGLVLCRTHVVELRHYRFGYDREPLQVRAVAIREQLFGMPLRCGMCESRYVRGNLCENEGCKTPLHPQWPAVYCSNDCAFEDS